MRNLSLWLFGFILVICIFAPLLTPYDPMQTNAAEQLTNPSPNHPLGTDILGRDVLSRLLYGGRHTLLITVAATSLAVVGGSLVGIISGISNRWVDRILSICMVALLAFPNLLFSLILLTLMGTGDQALIVSTGFAQFVPVARVIRAATVAVRSMPYIEASYAVGSTKWHVLLSCILPNISSTLAVYAAITFSYCLLSSVALSFLGFGGQPGIPDWGIMLAEGRMAFRTAPWLAIAPGFLIMVCVWVVNDFAEKVN